MKKVNGRPLVIWPRMVADFSLNCISGTRLQRETPHTGVWACVVSSVLKGVAVVFFPFRKIPFLRKRAIGMLLSDLHPVGRRMLAPDVFVCPGVSSSSSPAAQQECLVF